MYVVALQLCAGSVRSKNVSNTLIMNSIDCCVVGVCFYLVGYGLAFGEALDGASNGFIGTGDFALSLSKISGLHWHMWFFHWAVAAAVVTIAAGALAERCKMEAYLVYSAAIATFIYPIIAHWCACITLASVICVCMCVRACVCVCVWLQQRAQGAQQQELQ
jgi:ammonium transporter, Amt family